MSISLITESRSLFFCQLAWAGIALRQEGYQVDLQQLLGFTDGNVTNAMLIPNLTLVDKNGAQSGSTLAHHLVSATSIPTSDPPVAHLAD